jgi:hypothetical protein
VLIVATAGGLAEGDGVGLDARVQEVDLQEQQNEQLLQLSNQILELTRVIHAMNTARSPTGSNDTEQAARSSIRNAMGQ